MAAKRMFSIDVVDTDKFLDMPVSTQALYFHFGMRADDDGFVASPRKIVKIANCTNDDLKVLISKGYVIPFQSGVIVITDWKTNNFIRSDRYKANMDANALNVDARTRDRIIKTSIVLQMPEENLRKKKAAAEQQSFLQMILQQQGR